MHTKLRITTFLLTALFSMYSSAAAWAQEGVASETNSTTTHQSSEVTTSGMAWMNNPYIWAGAGVFAIILLILLFTRKSATSTNEVKRTVVTKTEVSND